MKLALGLDFGTLSVRALLLDIESGREVCVCGCGYEHGVLDDTLPSGRKLGADWALQVPSDYINAMVNAVKEVMAAASREGVRPEDIVGIGSDFTSSTIVAVDEKNVPLCEQRRFSDDPHAYVKLWKHHSAVRQAEELQAAARGRGEPFIARYGHCVSCEWLFPKVLETYDCAADVYAAADMFIEGGDWIVRELTGIETRNSNSAGFKAFWDVETCSYPPAGFFESVRPGIGRTLFSKIRGNVRPPGTQAGVLLSKYAEAFGLPAGIPVSVGVMDAHSAFPSLGVVETGALMMIVGTSTCHELMVRESGFTDIPGMCGVVRDGLLPGFNNYEMAQAGVGDSFAWYMEHCLPASCKEEAASRGVSPYRLLDERAERLAPGENGIVALDWWNGTRSGLNDQKLSGTLVGLSVQTKPEEIYRALVEATAFGARAMISMFERHGLGIDRIYAAGGISRKSPFVMQTYADIIGKPVYIADSQEAAARGAAIYGAACADPAVTGFTGIISAVRELGSVLSEHYIPNPENKAVYDKLFGYYGLLHDFFGVRQTDIMHGLKDLRATLRPGGFS